MPPSYRINFFLLNAGAQVGHSRGHSIIVLSIGCGQGRPSGCMKQLLLIRPRELEGTPNSAVMP